MKNRPFPSTRHIAYTTACSYCASCDFGKLFKVTSSVTDVAADP